jgi:hypothetical protein
MPPRHRRHRLCSAVLCSPWPPLTKFNDDCETRGQRPQQPPRYKRSCATTLTVDHFYDKCYDAPRPQPNHLDWPDHTERRKPESRRQSPVGWKSCEQNSRRPCDSNGGGGSTQGMVERTRCAAEATDWLGTQYLTTVLKKALPCFASRIALFPTESAVLSMAFDGV